MNEYERYVGYICRDCAMELGGTWKDGHVATTHTNTCSVCKKEKSVCSPYDWNLDRQGKPHETTAEEWD